MDPELRKALANLETLIKNTSSSLHEAITEVGNSLHAEITEVGKTVERDTRMLGGGATQLAAITTWMGKQDAREAKQEAELKRLRLEIRELKKGRSKGGAK